MANTEKILIAFHGNCYDGFGAAWAAWRHFGDRALYTACIYGQPLDLPSDLTALYFVDYAPPREELLRLRSIIPLVMVLDHHVTARDALAKLPDCYFDIEKSGAHVTWDYFWPTTPPPKLIRYLEDRDLWLFRLPFTREIHGWLQSYPREFPLWNKLAGRLETEFGEIAEHGKAIVRFKQEQVKEMATQVQWVTLAGHRVPVANATAFFSEVGEELCLRYPDAPFAGYYLDRVDGQRQWGLRSRGGFDVSEVAKVYGGGGHKTASGFTTAQGWIPLVQS